MWCTSLRSFAATTSILLGLRIGRRDFDLDEMGAELDHHRQRSTGEEDLPPSSTTCVRHFKGVPSAGGHAEQCVLDRPAIEQDFRPGRDAEQLDPRFVGDPYGLRVSRLLFGSLVTIDPRTLEVIPDLAESVEVLSPTRFEVRLREGLRFSDGTPLDARDVIATFEGVVDPKLQSRYAQNYRRIAEMQVPNPRTILFILREQVNIWAA